VVLSGCSFVAPTESAETAVASPEAIFECKENLVPLVDRKREYPEPTYSERQMGYRAMQFIVYESTASENSFAIKAFVRNRSTYDYMLRKTGATLYFTKHPKDRTYVSIPYHEINRVASANITIDAWEDGESPALRLKPCEQKWIRITGTITGTEAVNMLHRNFAQASISLWNYTNFGWLKGASYTSTLHKDFISALKQGCWDTSGCSD